MGEGRRESAGRASWDLAVVGLPLALLYLLTAARDVGTIDSGELAVVCARLGVAHPTGYPLYTLIGRLAVRLWPGRPIDALTLLSSLAAVVASVLVVVLTRAVLRSLQRPARMATNSGSTDTGGVRGSAGPGAGPGSFLTEWLPRLAGLWLGTNLVLWNQATGNEVYALHLVFVVLLLLLGGRLLAGRAQSEIARDLVVLTWVLGLALSHHLSVVFLLPALLFALGVCLFGCGRLRLSRAATTKNLAWAGTAFLLAWSIQLYLPVRSARNPCLDWGDPTSWDRFWRHYLAGQYRVWFFESGQQWWGNLTEYMRSLPDRFLWPVLILALAGAWTLARHTRRLAVYFCLTFVVTLVWAASYSIHDLAPYFLPADVVLALLAAIGAGAALTALGTRVRSTSGARTAPEPRRERALLRGAVGAMLLLVLLQIGLHFREADRKKDHLIRFYAETLLRALPPRAILLSRHWDGLISASLYLQEVEGLRRDVTVIDTELLRRSWYYPQLRRWDATLLAPMEDRVTAFLQQVSLFEGGRPYDPSVIQSAYLSVIDGIAQLHRCERPTCFTPEVESTFLRSAAPIPEGLVYVLREKPAESPVVPPPDVEGFSRAGYRPEDSIHQQVAEQWVKMTEARIRFLQRMERRDEARSLEPLLLQLQTMSGPRAFNE